jgi:hypothetical protein
VIPDRAASAHLRDLLCAAGYEHAEIARREPMRGGLSGARLTRLALRHPMPGGAARYTSVVYKRIAPLDGWLGEASRDCGIREVRLWSSGILGDLPHALAMPTLAYGYDGPEDAPEAGAVLLADVRGALLREPLRAPRGRLPRTILALLDHLAWLHARYWCDPRLRDPALGLMPYDAALRLIAPEGVAARLACGDTTPYLTLAVAGWEAFFRLAPRGAAATLRDVLHAPDVYLPAIERLPWTLAHGDVWGPNLGWLPPTRIAPRTGRRLLLLDWALATAGPATYDPLWLCGTWHALQPPRILAAYRARLERHLSARGIDLPAATWRSLADAGYLRTALTCGEALGRAAAEAPSGAARERAEQWVRWWAERAARAARHLLR